MQLARLIGWKSRPEQTEQLSDIKQQRRGENRVFLLLFATLYFVAFCAFSSQLYLLVVPSRCCSSGVLKFRFCSSSASVTCFWPKARGPRGKVRVEARGCAVVLASSKHASSSIVHPPFYKHVPHGRRLLLPCLGSEEYNGRGRCPPVDVGSAAPYLAPSAFLAPFRFTAAPREEVRGAFAHRSANPFSSPRR